MEQHPVFGVVNDIQRMCTCDGPGFRTVVFLKGCYLDCRWCHNPEGKRRFPEVIPYVGNCEGCGECLTVCPTGAVTVDDGLGPRIDRGLCSTCLQCVKACKYDALVLWGRIMLAEQVVAEVELDKMIHVNSGGGVTISGGEPMAQPDFVLAIMAACKARGISTALDTCGHAPWEDLKRVLEYTDLVMFDIKQMDGHKHREYSGVGNELILENAKRIASLGVPIRFRIPIIPGSNDSTRNWESAARFIECLGDAVLGVDLLPYHPFAGGKYRAFGMDYPYPGGEGLADDDVAPVIDLFLKHVPEVTVGG
ncbi:MAG: glycyl-radical enzyme activating protein [Desulfomonile tiedjei]|nr:glycyl-radical enzyme activating protein [Desulfomonile tiedjei]